MITKKWETFLRSYTRWVIRNAPLVLILYIPLMLGAGYSVVSFLGINTDLSDMISERLEFHGNWVRYKEEFPHLNDHFLVVVDSEDRLQAREFVRRLSQEVKSRPEFFEHSAWLNTPDLYGPKSFHLMSEDEKAQVEMLFSENSALIRSFADQPNPVGMMQVAASIEDTEEASVLRQQFHEIDQNKRMQLSYEEIFADEYLEDDRQYFEVKGVMDYEAILPAESALYELRRVISSIKTEDVNVGITGPAALGYEELKSVSDGAALSAIISLILVSLILILALRSFRLIVMTLSNLIVGLVLTAGFAALTVGHLNMISVAFAVLFIGLGVDYSIHLCSRYRELRAKKSNDEAIEDSVVHIGSSLVLCSITTALGFFAFVPTSYAGVSELGIISGSGMFINLFVHMSLLPALFKVFPNRRYRVKERFNPGALLAKWAFGRPALAIGGCLVLVFAAGASLPFSQFDSNPLNLQNPHTEAYKVYRNLLKESDSSPWTIKILERDETKIAEIEAALLELEEVSHVVSIKSFERSEEDRFQLNLPSLKVENFEASEDLFARNQVFFARQFKERYPKLSEASSELWQERLVNPSLNFYEDLRSLERQGQQTPVEMSERYLSENGVYRIEVFPTKDLMNMDNMREFAERVLEVSPQATDDPVTLPLSGDAVVQAFIQATATALILIFLVILVITRRLQDALIVSFPLITAGVLTLGFVNLLRMDFNFANIIVVPLLLGIGVDSGIHLVHRFRSSRIKDALSGTTSQAIFYSSFTTIFSFGTLYLSPHRGTASMGLLLTVGTMIVMLSTLIVIPACMKWVLKGSDAQDSDEESVKKLAS